MTVYCNVLESFSINREIIMTTFILFLRDYISMASGICFMITHGFVFACLSLHTGLITCLWQGEKRQLHLRLCSPTETDYSSAPGPVEDLLPAQRSVTEWKWQHGQLEPVYCCYVNSCKMPSNRQMLWEIISKQTTTTNLTNMNFKTKTQCRNIRCFGRDLSLHPFAHYLLLTSCSFVRWPV